MTSPSVFASRGRSHPQTLMTPVSNDFMRLRRKIGRHLIKTLSNLGLLNMGRRTGAASHDILLYRSSYYHLGCGLLTSTPTSTVVAGFRHLISSHLIKKSDIMILPETRRETKVLSTDRTGPANSGTGRGAHGGGFEAVQKSRCMIHRTRRSPS